MLRNIINSTICKCNLFCRLRDLCIFTLEKLYLFKVLFLYWVMLSFCCQFTSITATCFSISFLHHLPFFEVFSQSSIGLRLAIHRILVLYRHFTQRPKFIGNVVIHKRLCCLISLKVLYLIFTIVLLFWACFLPFWIWQLLGQFYPSLSLSTKAKRNINYLTTCLTYSNSCINPFLYTLLTKNYKEYLRKHKRSWTAGNYFSRRSRFQRSPRRSPSASSQQCTESFMLTHTASLRAHNSSLWGRGSFCWQTFIICVIFPLKYSSNLSADDCASRATGCCRIGTFDRFSFCQMEALMGGVFTGGIYFMISEKISVYTFSLPGLNMSIWENSAPWCVRVEMGELMTEVQQHGKCLGRT